MLEDDVETLAQAIESTPGWNALRKEYYRYDKRGKTKYFIVRAWIRMAFKRWEAIHNFDPNLLPSKPSVLDIGTGFGYFPLSARYFSKSKIIDATDVPDPLYDRVTALLGVVPKYELSVRAFTLLNVPNDGQRYDLITAYGIVFDDDWGEAEWRFFLNDVKHSLLNKGGTIVLGFNKGRDKKFKRWSESESEIKNIASHDLILTFETIKKLSEGETC